MLLYARITVVAVCLFLIPCTAPRDAAATTVLQVDLRGLTTTSQWVVRAQVLATRNVDLLDRNKGVFTDVDLLITHVYRGANVPHLYTLRMIGGTATNGNRLKVPGMPVFKAGEDVVLFLEATSMGHIPTGLGQGVWRVLTTPNGDEWARQSMGDVHLLKRGADGRLGPADPSTTHATRALDDLVSDIYKYSW